MQTATIILVVGLLIFISHLFSALFDKVRIPDVLPLVLLGLLIGPIFHLVSPSDFGEIGPVFTSLALVIILFEGGLDLNVNLLKTSFLPSIKLALTTFVSTFVIMLIIGAEFLHMTRIEATLLGLMLMATSPPIVIPMMAKLNLRESIKTTLILDSTICEVLGIICTLAVLKASTHHDESITKVVGAVISSFTLSIALGIIAALIWSNVLRIIRRVENNIFCTPAFVCIVYGLAELLGFSGPVAALSFGISLGNIRKIINALPSKYAPADHSALTDREVSFFSAMVFVVKTFFFVYLGVTIHFDNNYVVLVSILLTTWIFLSRLIVVKFAGSQAQNPIEAAMVTIMVPKGLATAVLATLVTQSNIIAGNNIKEIAYGVILFTISTTALLAFMLEKGWLDMASAFIFKGSYKAIPEPPNYINQ